MTRTPPDRFFATLVTRIGNIGYETSTSRPVFRILQIGRERMIRALRQFLRNPFRGVVFDAEKNRRFMQMPTANRRYVIFFTPRSGSTRLTEILGNTKALDTPNERFNPDFIPTIAQDMSARNIDELVEILVRRRAQNGVFGVELTYLHLLQSFRRERVFMRHFNSADFFWLIRRDIVAQAVSATLMVQTGVSHKVRGAEENSDSPARYDATAIRQKIRQIAWLERRTEAFFTRHELTPVRLTYESLVARSPDQIAEFFATRLSVDSALLVRQGSRHQKLADARSAEFATRFRSENSAWMRRIDMRRQPLLKLQEEDEELWI